jgi:hypothetical protein
MADEKDPIDQKDPIDEKDPIVDADEVREQVHTTIERLREKLPDVLDKEPTPTPLTKPDNDS